MTSNISLLQQSLLQSEYGVLNSKEAAYRKAGRLFRRVYLQGIRGRIWAALVGRRSQLLDLTETQKQHSITARHYAGVQTVPIQSIQGSEGRQYDFDANFRPMYTNNQARWESVAAARFMGINLPLVELIKLGDIYFVLDGHHRISVARAAGQEHVDAEVTVWQLSKSTSQDHREKARAV